MSFLSRIAPPHPTPWAPLQHKKKLGKIYSVTLYTALLFIQQFRGLRTENRELFPQAAIAPIMQRTSYQRTATPL